MKYAGLIQTGDGKAEVKAIAFDAATGKSSPVANEKFDISRKNWKVLGTDDKKADAILDGNPSSAWRQPKEKKLPIDLIIDLGKMEHLRGFRYLPNQSIWGPGIITTYQFYVSKDNKKWELVNVGEFSNIKNNPLWQSKTFDPVEVRYIKLRALGNTEGNDNIAYAEIDVITD